MALDLTKTATQLYGAAPAMRVQNSARASALAEAASALARTDAHDVEMRRLNGKATWLIASAERSLSAVTAAISPPIDYAIVAVDGSHIDVDRHSPARCYVINIGYVSLVYGQEPHAILWNEPLLRADETSLMLSDPEGTKHVAIEGPLLGMSRAVMEIEALVQAIERVPADLPVLCLLDGTLVLWGLAGGGYPDFVRKELIGVRLVSAMDRLRLESERRTLAVASYISLPRSQEVVNALRISRDVCGWDQVNCDANCGQLRRGTRNCDSVDGVTDADLFSAVLRKGERSTVFRTASSIVTDYYGDHQIGFFYVNVGEETARVEFPAWTTDAGIALVHAGLLSQAAKGDGYPLALQEAHEQAVISTADREYFARLIYETLSSENLPTPTSQKSRSKRTRFI